MLEIYNDDCITSKNKLQDRSVDLIICDPPFGLGESQFDKHYSRNINKVIKGYTEAPQDYAAWTLSWLSEAKRVLKDNGSMYVVMGHTNLRQLLNAAHNLELYEKNHLIWKYNFGVNTSKKFVTSHYHVLYYTKNKKNKPTFNTYCRFGAQEKNADGGSALYQDLEDVFNINREYAPNQYKNQNKLPEALISKLIQYSSNADDTVCDFFMGNFTTAYVAHKLGRHVKGYEINKIAYDYHMAELQKLTFASSLQTLKKIPADNHVNRGLKLSTQEKTNIRNDFAALVAQGHTKKDANILLQDKYGRGKFAIQNIIKNI